MCRNDQLSMIVTHKTEADAVAEIRRLKTSGKRVFLYNLRIAGVTLKNPDTVEGTFTPTGNQFRHHVFYKNGETWSQYIPPSGKNATDLFRVIQSTVGSLFPRTNQPKNTGQVLDVVELPKQAENAVVAVQSEIAHRVDLRPGDVKETMMAVLGAAAEHTNRAMADNRQLQHLDKMAVMHDVKYEMAFLVVVVMPQVGLATIARNLEEWLDSFVHLSDGVTKYIMEMENTNRQGWLDVYGHVRMLVVDVVLKYGASAAQYLSNLAESLLDMGIHAAWVILAIKILIFTLGLWGIGHLVLKDNMYRDKAFKLRTELLKHSKELTVDVLPHVLEGLRHKRSDATGQKAITGGFGEEDPFVSAMNELLKSFTDIQV